ncbi:CcdB family protein [Mesorhizobium sp. M0152]|uniref:CcdB family protein n=1 Tax=Mesorhizobium sp. M0152 TaxID=2956898 RepID=UPI0033399A0B
MNMSDATDCHWPNIGCFDGTLRSLSKCRRYGYLLDVQSELLEGLGTRVVVPLMPPNIAPVPGDG